MAEIATKKISDLIPYVNNARTHSDEQITSIAASVKEWSIISGYAVSRCGVVVRLPYKSSNRWGGTSHRRARVLSSSNDKDGYQLMTVKKLGWNKNGQVRLHRLIAHCWIGKCPLGLEVNHKDGNKKNNHAENLEYVTSKQNKLHAVSTGLIKTGNLHHNTKGIKMVKNDVALLLFGSKDIASHGFHSQSVNRAARGERNGYKGWTVSYV